MNALESISYLDQALELAAKSCEDMKMLKAQRDILFRAVEDALATIQRQHYVLRGFEMDMLYGRLKTAVDKAREQALR